MLLSVSEPIRATDYFDFPEDSTPWTPVSYENDYIRCKKGGRSPIRERASYHAIRNAAIPHDRSSWHSRFGIYILFLNVPSPTLYIGIASEDARAPEGILSRVQKHRVKMSGSHVGPPLGCGGVHHPKRWGEFAIDRRHDLAGRADDLADLRIAMGYIQNVRVQKKKDLEFFESRLINNHMGLIESISQIAWPSFDGVPRILNRAPSIKQSAPEATVILWSGKPIVLKE